MHDLYANLPTDAAAHLSGVAGAAQLKEAGYTAVAVQAGAPDGAITLWDLKLAGFAPASSAAAAAANVATNRRSSTQTCSSTGAAQPPAVAAALQQQDGVGLAAGAAGAACSSSEHSSRQLRNNQQQQQQQPDTLRADGPGDVEYFRHQSKTLMHMQPGTDLPDLLIGTKVGMLWC